jgi:hypothetical protein
MADIQMAAAWMRSGYDVARISCVKEWWLVPYEPRRDTFALVTANGRERELSCDDLSADDWKTTDDALMEAE